MDKEEFLNSLENYKIGNDGNEILDYIREKVVNNLYCPEKFEFGIEWIDARDGSKKISVVSRFFGGNYSINFKYDKKEYVLRFPTIDFKYKVDNFYLYEKDFIDGIMKNQHFDISKYGLTSFGTDEEPSFKDIFTTDDFDKFIDNVWKCIN